MLAILIMYIFIFGLMYLTYTVISISKSRIFTKTLMRKFQNQMVSKKAVFLLSLAHAFYVTLFIVCVMMATSFSWTLISIVVFFFGIKYSRRLFNDMIRREIEKGQV